MRVFDAQTLLVAKELGWVFKAYLVAQLTEHRLERRRMKDLLVLPIAWSFPGELRSVRDRLAPDSPEIRSHYSYYSFRLSVRRCNPTRTLAPRLLTHVLEANHVLGRICTLHHPRSVFVVLQYHSVTTGGYSRARVVEIGAL